MTDSPVSSAGPDAGEQPKRSQHAAPAIPPAYPVPPQQQAQPGQPGQPGQPDQQPDQPGQHAQQPDQPGQHAQQPDQRYQQPAAYQPPFQPPLQGGQQPYAPQVPLPQQPYPGAPTQPGQPAPQGYLQPQAAYGVPPQQPGGNGSAFGQDIKLVLRSFVHIFQGAELDVARRFRASTFAAVISLAILCIFGGLFSATSKSHAYYLADHTATFMLHELGGPGTDGALEISFGAWFSAFISVAVFSAIMVLLRTLAIFLSAKIAKATLSFVDCVKINGAAYTPLALLLVPCWLLFLLPSAVMFTFILGVLSIIVPTLTFMAELTIVRCIENLGQPTRSVVVPYAWLTTAYVIIATLFGSVIVASSFL